jgi:hypothetical protein
MQTNQDLTKDLENTVTTGSSNVYADLGYENPEEMLLKAQLANHSPSVNHSNHSSDTR